MARDTSKRELEYHVDQIAWIMDPEAGPGKLLRFVLAHCKETKKMWTVYEVKSSERSFRYYWYIFILTALAYHLLQKDDQEQFTVSGEQFVQFPLHANDPVYGLMVRHYYGLNVKETDGKPYRYLAIPVTLRQGMRAIFKPVSRGGGAKNSRIELTADFTRADFSFWNVRDFPVDMFADQTPREVDIKKLNFPKIPVSPDVIDASIRQIHLSKWWNLWEKGSRKKKAARISHEYFQPIEDTLQISATDRQSKWFRNSGPIYVDFRDGKICINKKRVAALEKHILSHKISMLEWPSGTGKTVLVRSVCYEHLGDEDRKIFYFDCGHDREFLVLELINEIERKDGILIVENIHLAIRKLRIIFLELQSRNLPDKHILFTSSVRISERAFLSPDELAEMNFFPQHELFEDADEIISRYTSGELEQPLPLMKHEDIKKITRGNYKWLGYVLQGCVKEMGKGDPKQWLRKGVMFELEHLEYGLENPVVLNRLNKHLPEVLVALSPLYMNEILTAEIFLTKNLHFKEQDLGALVDLGKITRHQSRDGHIFYGLPHMVQAGAYWKYGQAYKDRRNLGDYKKFIYDYALSGAPNTLEPILQSAANNKLLKRVSPHDEIADVVDIEIWEIIHWVRAENTTTLIDNNILPVLGQKLARCKDEFEIDLFVSGICNNSQEAEISLDGLIDRRRDLGEDFSKSCQAVPTSPEIGLSLSAYENKACYLCDLFNFKEMRLRLSYEDDIISIGRSLALAVTIYPIFARKLLHSLKRRSLQDKMNRSETSDDWLTLCCFIYSYDPHVAFELFSLWDVEELERRFPNKQNLWCIVESFDALNLINKNAGL